MFYWDQPFQPKPVLTWFCMEHFFNIVLPECCLIPDYFDAHANSLFTETMVQSVNIDVCKQNSQGLNWLKKLIDQADEKSI